MAEIFLDAGGDGPVWRAGLLDGLVLLVHVVVGVGIVVTSQRARVRSAVLRRESGRCDHGCDHGCCGGVGFTYAGFGGGFSSSAVIIRAG